MACFMVKIQCPRIHDLLMQPLFSHSFDHDVDVDVDVDVVVLVFVIL